MNKQERIKHFQKEFNRTLSPVEQLLIKLGDWRTNTTKDLWNTYCMWRDNKNTKMMNAVKNVTLSVLASAADKHFDYKQANKHAYQRDIIAASGVDLESQDLPTIFREPLTFRFAQPQVSGAEERSYAGGSRLSKSIHYVNPYFPSNNGSDLTVDVRGSTYHFRRGGGEIPLGDDALSVIPLLFAHLGDPTYAHLLQEEDARHGQRKKYERKEKDLKVTQGLEDRLQKTGIDTQQLSKVKHHDHLLQAVSTGDESEIAYWLEEVNQSTPHNWLAQSHVKGDLNQHPEVLQAWVDHVHGQHLTRAHYNTLKAFIAEVKPEGKARSANLIEDLQFLEKLAEKDEQHPYFEHISPEEASLDQPFQRIRVYDLGDEAYVDASDGSRTSVRALWQRKRLTIAEHISLWEQYPYKQARTAIVRDVLSSYVGEGKQFAERVTQLEGLQNSMLVDGLNKRQKSYLNSFLETAQRNSKLDDQATAWKSSVDNFCINNVERYAKEAGLLAGKQALYAEVKGDDVLEKHYAHYGFPDEQSFVTTTDFVHAADVHVEDAEGNALSLEEVFDRIERAEPPRIRETRSTLGFSRFSYFQKHLLPHFRREAKHGLVHKYWGKKCGVEKITDLQRSMNDIKHYVDITKDEQMQDQFGALRIIQEHKDLNFYGSSISLTTDKTILHPAVVQQVQQVYADLQERGDFGNLEELEGLPERVEQFVQAKREADDCYGESFRRLDHGYYTLNVRPLSI